MTSVDIEDTEFVPPPHLANYWVFVKMDALGFLRTLDKSTGAHLLYFTGTKGRAYWYKSSNADTRRVSRSVGSRARQRLACLLS